MEWSYIFIALTYWYHDCHAMQSQGQIITFGTEPAEMKDIKKTYCVCYMLE